MWYSHKNKLCLEKVKDAENNVHLATLKGAHLLISATTSLCPHCTPHIELNLQNHIMSVQILETVGGTWGS